MNVFTDVYEKSRAILLASDLDDDWKDVASGLKGLLEADGPNVAQAPVLKSLRDKLRDAKKWYQFGEKAIAEGMLNASKPETRGFQERAALLKAMYHFYLVGEKGGQSVWVVDSPKAYGQWFYDQLDNLPKDALTGQLKKSSEVFGQGNRDMMSNSLQLARKWSSQVEAALSGGKADVKAKVMRWFHAEGDADSAVGASVTTLLNGFKRIHNSCNSNQVIFSDRPHLRASGDYDSTYASVNGRDAMPVIYIYQLFLDTGRRTLFGNVPKMWLCALTVIHELSHKLVSTKDNRYDHDGLKPGAGFSAADALNNADSWAYFAADVVDALSEATLKKVLV